jgi:GNAT superfamily N-acetyltransferase
MAATNTIPPLDPPLSVECLEPPVDAVRARTISALIYEHLREERLEEILLGRHSADAEFRMMIGRVGGELAATCWLGWGRGSPEIGVMGGVVTRGPWRGKGIARRLVTAGCERFDAAGGRLLYLATTNPDARRIYEGLGFRGVVGHVLCRAAEGASPREGTSPGQRVRARAASWRDMAAIAPLYFLPHPCVLVDAGTLFPSVRLSPPWKCVRIFWDTWGSLGPGGRWRILENEAGRLVASAMARPAAGIGPQFAIDFAWHPDYVSEASSLIRTLIRDAEAESGRPCEMQIAEGDDWKRAEAARFGFRDAGRTGLLFELEGRRLALYRLTRDRSAPAAPQGG